jgi:hypothetical protein
MSPEEQAFMGASPDALRVQALVDVSWLMESAECLLWALGLLDALPPYDTQAEMDHLNKLPGRSIMELQSNAALRVPKIISRARDVAELWHWRSRTRELMEAGTPVSLPGDWTLRDIIRIAAESAAREGIISANIDGDFPIFGKAYGRVSADEWSQAASIAKERHRALNWLCGYAPRNRWEDTPTDT